METCLSPQQAWQAAVLDLQLDMQSGTFKSRVMPAQLLSFTSETFTIGCNSPENRDWLAGRLTATLTRSLTDYTGHPVLVNFITTPVPISSPSPEGEELQFSPEVQGEALLRPDRIVRFPLYFLRWLPYVGPQIIFLVTALWQEHYLSSRGETGRLEDKTVSVKAEAICRWAGISRATLFRLLNEPALAWFASRQTSGHIYDNRLGQCKKAPNHYRLHGLPLTPGDASNLARFLKKSRLQDNPRAVLQTALITSPQVIFSQAHPSTATGDRAAEPRPIFVRDVVAGLLDECLSPELTTLCDRLADHLQTTQFIRVTWYFLENWLPLLGPDAGMFVLLLRAQCFFNEATGEVRDETWMTGGYQEMAMRLGLGNPRQVATWFPAHTGQTNHKTSLTTRSETEIARQRHLQGLLSQFVQRIGCRPSEGSMSWKFRVQRADPLIPAHQALLGALTRLLELAPAADVASEIEPWIHHLTQRCSETASQEPFSRLVDGCSDPLKALLNACFEPVDLAGKDCFETLLKILKSLKDSSEKRNPPPTEPNAWRLEELLTRVDRKNRAYLLAHEVSPLPLISWLIYGAAQSCIQNPLSLAVARLKENPGQSAGGACTRLASLPPSRLTGMIRDALYYQPVFDPDWQTTLSKAAHSRLRLLADLLDLDLT